MAAVNYMQTSLQLKQSEKEANENDLAMLVSFETFFQQIFTEDVATEKGNIKVKIRFCFANIKVQKIYTIWWAMFNAHFQCFYQCVMQGKPM